MDIILLVLHVVLSLGIITLVLLQKGAGASAGGAFWGGGGAGSVFGATGSANFLSKTTAIFAVGFFVNSLLLAYLASNRDMQTDSVMDALIAPAVEITTEVPVEGVPAPEGFVVPAADAVLTQDAQSGDVPPTDVPAPAE